MKAYTTDVALSELDADLVAVGIFEGEEPSEPLGSTAGATDASGEFKSQVIVYPGKPERVVILGLGKKEDFTPEKARVIGAVSQKALKQVKGEVLAWALPEGPEGSEPGALAAALVEGAGLSAFEFDRYRSGSDGEEAPPALKAVEINTDQDIAALVRVGEVVAHAGNRARYLQSLPATAAPPEYLAALAEEIRSLQQTPGREVQPAAQASFDAWIKYYRPDENSRNSSQSYYVSGALAALLLDLAVRKATGGERCLDDVVRMLWQTTWKKGRGYTHADVVDALTTIAGVDLADTVHELVEQPFRPDFAAAFADFGVLLETQAETTPALGLQWRADGSTVAAVLTGSPAAAAGIAAGDEILAFDGHRVNGKNAHSLYELLAKNRRRIEVLLARRGLVLARTIELPDLGTGDVRLVFDPRPSPAAERLRAGWLRVAPKPAAPV